MQSAFSRPESTSVFCAAGTTRVRVAARAESAVDGAPSTAAISLVSAFDLALELRGLEAAWAWGSSTAHETTWKRPA